MTPSPPVKYVMPQVKIGDAVLWAHDKSRMADPAPAIVTRVGAEAIGLLFFPPDSRAGTPRDGVRFVDDPANARIASDAGVFDFAADRKRLDAVQAALADLASRFEKLLDELADDGK